MPDNDQGSAFEDLERSLGEALRELEDESAEIPLERRVALHAKAVRLHAAMEDVLAAAEKEVRPGGDGEASEPTGAAPAEPYEQTLGRLRETVRELERDDLPLARVIELHHLAEALTGRCEAILASAQKRLDDAGPGDARRKDPAATDADDEPGPF